MNRIRHIDIAKGIGIYLVLISHSQVGKLDFFISNFFMQFFFFLSGYTTKYKSISNSNFLTKKFKHLLLPYFFYNFMLYLLFIIISIINNNINFINIITPLIGIFYSRYCLYDMKYATLKNINNVFFFNIFNSPLWFLTCLFISYSIFYIIIKISKNESKKIALCLFIAFIVAYLLDKHLNILLPWSVDTAFLGVVFLGIGYLLQNIDWENIISDKKITIFFIYLIFSYLNGSVNLSIREYGNNYIISLFTALLGIINCWFFAKYLDKKFKFISNYLCYIGKNTILILSLHLLIFNFIYKIIYLFDINLNFIKGSILYGVLISFIALLILNPIIKIKNSIIYKITSKNLL